MTVQCTSREDRLFVLATICRQKNIDPNSNLYKTTIVKVNAQSFHLPQPRLNELTALLTSAYRADRWASILGEIAPTQPTQEPITITKIETPQHTPKQDAMILKGLARRDTYDGVGRLILKEIQVELGPITPEEIIETWETYNHKDTIQQEGNLFKIYWGGKADLEEKRSLRTAYIPTEKPQLFSRLEIQKEEPLETADFKADKECDGIGEVMEDSEGVVEEEDELGDVE